jgi:hypothetical protein
MPKQSMCDLRLVAIQRLDQRINEQTASRAEEADELQRGKAAAGPLSRRLAERLLQRGRVRHRAGRAVDEEHAMTAPARKRFIRRLQQHTTRAMKEHLKHAQGKTLARLAVGAVGRLNARQQPRAVRAGGIAVEDLQGEEPDGGDGIEHACPPAVAHRSADEVDETGIKRLAHARLERIDGGCDTGGHP